MHDAGKPSQRFFFGHNNDITCMTIHPNRRYVSAGPTCRGSRRGRAQHESEGRAPDNLKGPRITKLLNGRPVPMFASCVPLP